MEKFWKTCRRQSYVSPVTILEHEASTRRAGLFNILRVSAKPSVEEAHHQTSGGHACRKHRTNHPTGREAHSPRFTTPKFPTQIRHMGFRPEPSIL
ncbi:MAG: hypothetical protein SGJ26_10110 [Nitrospirota bacterium]|nr:hypothetical protein [Nitrospirota bacterium]